MLRIGKYDRSLLGRWDRQQLRRALALLRYQDRHPTESIPSAAQYDGIATTCAVMAEYRRRGWKIPKITAGER